MGKSKKYVLTDILEELSNGKSISRKLRTDIINNVGSLESILTIVAEERIVDYMGEVFGYVLKDGVSDKILIEKAIQLSTDSRLGYFKSEKDTTHYIN